MATTTDTFIDINTMLCADPVFGCVHSHLINGGSWYEADQMYWRILQKQALLGLEELTKTKSTKSSQEKAKTLLGHLEQTSTQLFPNDKSTAIFKQAEAVVQVWAPPPKAAPKAAVKTSNAFAAFDDDEE